MRVEPGRCEAGVLAASAESGRQLDRCNRARGIGVVHAPEPLPGAIGLQGTPEEPLAVCDGALDALALGG